MSPRVISGSAKGRKLFSLPGNIVRPITDRAKEALFNILGPDIFGAPCWICSPASAGWASRR